MKMMSDEKIKSLLDQRRALLAKRKEYVELISELHDLMTSRVRKMVAEFERNLYATDPVVQSQMELLDSYRALHHPLRTETWELDAKIQELEQLREQLSLAPPYHPGGAL